MNMVAANRADIFFELDQHGRYIARQNHLQNSIVEIPMPEEPEVYFHLCIAKTSVYASILPEFDAVMARIHADGTYDTILRRY
jgi:ABC-type amino acid transport substrate-binding protein